MSNINPEKPKIDHSGGTLGFQQSVEPIEYESILRAFHRRMRKFPPGARDVISEASSMFLEADVRSEFASNQDNITRFSNTLRAQGLKEADIWHTMTFFGLPYNKPESPRKI